MWLQNHPIIYYTRFHRFVKFKQVAEMEVLIDTNVFIEREGNWVIPEALQELENLLKSDGHTIMVHPLSKEEIRNYGNEDGRERAESKIATYPELSFPKYPKPSNREFRQHVAEGDDFNEQVDNALLFTVYLDRVDYLITEDQGIHEKAADLSISEQVLNIEQGRDRFTENKPAYEGPPSIQPVKVGDLDIDDPIFDSLKQEYGFEEWFARIPERDAYVNWNSDGSLGAILILKPNEAQEIGDDPILPKRERLKICTLKVASQRRGSKTGELLISIAIREAIKHGLEETYLTHRRRPEDYLVQLISQYGFERASDKDNGESVFVKRLTPGPGDDPNPLEANIRFYPSLYDGGDVKKFIIPIQPEFHSRLFPTYEKRHPKLTEFSGEFLSEGNAIRKAYLCHSNSRKVGRGDILLFYRSHDHKEITSICVCDRVEYDVTTVDEVKEIVGRRSVFTEHEIDELVQSPTTVILFKWHFDLENPVHYQVLRDESILSGPPISVVEIDESNYRYIRENGGIDERFIVN